MFARKTLRLFDSESKQDIENEARVVTKLSQKSHHNIIHVMRHGWLNPALYYIDMELCQKTLAHHIYSLNQNSGLPIHFYVNNWRRHFLRVSIEILLSIGLDILEGLAQIHRLGEVHRDLKPKNGNSPRLKMTLCSSFLRTRWLLESSRLRHRSRRHI